MDPYSDLNPDMRLRKFTLDDEPVDIAEFLEANAEGLDADEIAKVIQLRTGEEIVYGGGAQPLAVLKRVA
jgi:hypothetical protein